MREDGIQIERALTVSGGRLYLVPHPMLRDSIAHYTVTAAPQDGLGRALTLLPDASGCLVFTMAQGNLTCKLWGPTTKTVVVTDGDVSFRFFVEFLPCGLSRVLGIDAAAVADLRLGLSEIFLWLEREVLALFERLGGENALWSGEERAGRFSPGAQLAGGMDRIFLELMARRETNHTQAKQLMGLMVREGCGMSVRELSQKSFYSERQLSRILLPSLGMGAKQYLRLLRVNRAAQAMQREDISLTGLAVSLGYYDQAHFIHDYKTVCGLSPSAYRKSLSDFYNEPYKF